MWKYAFVRSDKALAPWLFSNKCADLIGRVAKDHLSGAVWTLVDHGEGLELDCVIADFFCGVERDTLPPPPSPDTTEIEEDAPPTLRSPVSGIVAKDNHLPVEVLASLAGCHAVLNPG